jgi:hypothetical protein
MENKKKQYYEVVVTDPNSWNPDGSRIIMHRCPHKHRTISGAVRCRENLIAYNTKTGTWSAKWHGATIMHTDGTHLSIEEREEWERIEYNLI